MSFSQVSFFFLIDKEDGKAYQKLYIKVFGNLSDSCLSKKVLLSSCKAYQIGSEKSEVFMMCAERRMPKGMAGISLSCFWALCITVVSDRLID